MKATLVALALSLPLALLVPGGADAASPQSSSPTLPHAFTAGTPALADEVNANFDALASFAGHLSDRIDVLPPRPSSDARIVVAPSGGEFASIADALTEAAARVLATGERVLVDVLPGTYQESSFLSVGTDVTLRGAGMGETRILLDRASFSTQSAVTLLDRSVASGFTVKYSGTLLGSGSRFTVGCFGDDALVEDVRVLTPDEPQAFGAFQVREGSATLRGCVYETDTSFGSDSGLVVTLDSTAVVEDCRFVLPDSPFSTNAIYVFESTATIRRTHLVGDVALYVVNNSTARVTGSELLGYRDAVLGTSGTNDIRIATSQVEGTLFQGTVVDFVHCYDAAFEPIPDA